MQKNNLTLLRTIGLVIVITLFLSNIVMAESQSSANYTQFQQNGKWGIKSDTGKIVVSAKFDECNELDTENYEVKQGKRIGFFYFETGKLIMLDPKVEEISYFSQGIAAVKVNKKWGFVDESGKFIISPKYQQVDYYYSDQPIKVEYKDKWGLISRNGSVIAKEQFDGIESFYSQEYAPVSLNNQWGYISKTGQIVLKPKYDEVCQSVYGDLFWVKIQNKWGVVDKQGKTVIKPIYESICSGFSEGLAAVKLGEKWGYIDVEGKTVINFQYDEAEAFNNGGAYIQTNGKKGEIDQNGKYVVNPKYSDFYELNESKPGYLVIQNIDENYITRYGLIDKSGKVILQPKYGQISYLGEGLLAVRYPDPDDYEVISSKSAVATLDGTFLTDYIFNEISEFKNGIASVSDGNEVYFIDINAKKINNMPIIKGDGSITMNDDGSIVADMGTKTYYFDKNGKKIKVESNETKLKDGYKLVEQQIKFLEKSDVQEGSVSESTISYPKIEGFKNLKIQNKINREFMKIAGVNTVKQNKQSIKADKYLGPSETYDSGLDYIDNIKDLLIMEFNSYYYSVGAAHGMPSMKRVLLNLKTGEFYSLKDLFKKNTEYTDIIKKEVIKQINLDDELKSELYEDYNIEISEDQNFSLEKDYLDIYFGVYEIAPYSSGNPEIKIPLKDIKSIIDTKGSLWKSFN